jgi:hypothetical protein
VWTNKELKTEADSLIQTCRLPELLAFYASWLIGGSYSYDLMCWRDLDIYVLDPQHDLKRCFEIGYELTDRLAAKKSRFTNNIGGEPNGLYWGIKLGDVRKDAWKLDIWFLDTESYDQHANYSARMRAQLTTENRSAILRIKEAYWRRTEYRDIVTGDLIYRAVFDNGARTVDDFELFLAKAQRKQIEK